jgi:hypothetical protein
MTFGYFLLEKQFSPSGWRRLRGVYYMLRVDLLCAQGKNSQKEVKCDILYIAVRPSLI